jgi:hypothetical protein
MGAAASCMNGVGNILLGLIHLRTKPLMLISLLPLFHVLQLDRLEWIHT